MNYEQEYKEALERAKALYENANGIILKKWVEQVFPELKESEEERIRKELIEFVKSRGGFKQEYIAWLESQAEHAKFYGSIQVGDKVTRNQDGVLVNLSQLKRVAKLEQQKPVEPQQDMLSQEKYAKAVDECIYGEQESADKVESKFHEGDWVVTNYGKVNQVVSVDKDGDGYTLDDGMYFSGSWCDMYHLWTIQDAKDGDVLHSPSHRLIWIYKDNEHYHTCVNMNYVTENVATDGLISIQNDTCPATNDERTILLSNLKKSGYEWDAEHKQLKKIEQNPTNEVDNYNHKEVLQTIINEQKPAENKGMNLVEEDMTPFQKKVFCIIDTTIEEEQGLKQVCDELLSLAIQEIEQKPAEWSEEDEYILNNIYDFVAENLSDKNRGVCADECLRWLKSRRLQSQWKPSEEQLKQLGKYCPDNTALTALYEYLRQL